ncbi:uncharacterized protein ColSpa_00006 [Colletotrichum spaethianum]|uniref:N-acetyltransferase domain-containing protein n=1 Tax=Colletotrichum spaethianum TaxID=700344 RepID=A0AA37L406_9PEZI|nr:uncharacterized protein ColSpa_00006 [Colletotrichum spaethianum]GKT39825.1 hypothetical protein ColSpa_00006 [Colletotrichum spaethianum]
MASASADHTTPIAVVRPAKADVALRLATQDDVAILASIADAAFLMDAHTQLKAAFRGADNFTEGMKQALEIWVDHPKVDVVVAEDKKSGRLVGWVGWIRRGFVGDTDLPLDGPSEEPTAETHFAARGKRTIQDLEDLTNASMDYWVKRFTPKGSKCRSLCSYVVHPDFQSRGVGSRLMKWGTDKADAEPGVYCSVQSSMGGQAAFERQGFQEVGRLEADLDDFAEGKKPGEEYEHVTGSKDSWGNPTSLQIATRPHAPASGFIMSCTIIVSEMASLKSVIIGTLGFEAQNLRMYWCPYVKPAASRAGQPTATVPRPLGTKNEKAMPLTAERRHWYNPVATVYRTSQSCFSAVLLHSAAFLTLSSYLSSRGIESAEWTSA